MLMNLDMVEICVEKLSLGIICSLGVSLVVGCWVGWVSEWWIELQRVCKVGLEKGVRYIVACYYLFYLAEAELLVGRSSSCDAFVLVWLMVAIVRARVAS